MGHLLSTVNPQAADYANELRPLPVVGTMVHYYPRAGEVRRGRRRVGAMVVHVDEDNRLLDLVIIHDANDFVDQQRVPERTGEDRGWVRMEAAGSGDEIAALRATVIELQKEVTSLRLAHSTLDAAVGHIAGQIDPKSAAVPLRRPGRPRKVVSDQD